MAVFEFTLKDGRTVNGTIIKKYKNADTNDLIYHLKDEDGDEWDIDNSDILHIKTIENDPHYLAKEITVLKNWEQEKEGGGPGGMSR